jgi:hypothetical protein
MAALVMDTSVVIDLERGGLLDSAFGCGWAIAVPDWLYENELAENSGPYLKTLGLGVLELTGAEVELAQQLKKARKPLSLMDCFAFALASRQGNILLSGDGALRAEAEQRRVPVHGVLWLLDRMEERGIAVPLLHEGLSRIAAHRNCRLPPAEVRLRLERWQGMIGPA